MYKHDFYPFKIFFFHLFKFKKESVKKSFDTLKSVWRFNVRPFKDHLTLKLWTLFSASPF